MKKRPKRLFERSITKTTLVLFLLICVVIALAMFGYYSRLRVTVAAESGGYMKEISSQIGENVSRTVNDNFSVLGTVSTVLKNGSLDSYEKIQPVIREQRTYWGYRNIYLIDDLGVARDADGHIINMGGDEAIRLAVVNRVRNMAPAQVVEGAEVILFLLPVEDLVVDGVEIRALAASYDPATLNETLSLSAFDGRGYCSLNNRDGSVVMRSGEGAAIDGYNTLSLLAASAKMDGGGSIDDVRSDLAAGRAGMVGFTLEGVHTYMAYTPLELREVCLMTFVPVEVVNASSQALMRLTLVMCGGITLLFALLLFALLRNAYQNARTLERLAYVDEITGGDTMQRFDMRAGELLRTQGHPPYALVYTNVEKFKVLNEQFGREACDELLRSLWQGPSGDLSDRECAGRITADNFCILVEWKGKEEILARIQNWYEMAAAYHARNNTIWMEPIMSAGIYPISDEGMPFEHMIDRAKLALRNSTEELHGHIRCAVYDDAVRRQLFREKQLEDMMENALKNRDFVVFLQPKYLVSDEKVGGAEALVRWRSASEGMIYPDEFIPIFEKNGFIVQLDLYVFEEVCRTLRRWIDAGVTPVKISVNCSPINLRSSRFLECYRALCEEWQVPGQYVEIELTENLVFEDVERLSQIIDEIHAAGFGCSMDDFGSGYSSLNRIQDIPVDTIKLDRVFFRTSERINERTESVVGCVLFMAKALKMTTVAEGVEELGQVEMLRRLGCDYIQGYYYAKPMSIPDFERLTYGRVIEETVI